MTRFGLRMLFYSACIGMVGIALLVGVSASASTIDWTTWSSGTSGIISSRGIAVTYSGEMILGLMPNFPSWMPSSTFSGGTVGNPPPQSGGMIAEEGGNILTDTITFSKPVENPVMALWSVGSVITNTEAEFDFNTGPFTIESGGPSKEFGGSTIVLCPGDPTSVCGKEGNGTVQFHGTFSSISWTQPAFENFYGWTVGAPVPEPNTLLLLGSAGLGLAGYVRKRFRFPREFFWRE